jgi:hypothetical protein
MWIVLEKGCGVDKELVNDICDLIAARCPYSFDEVRRQYDRFESFDLLIAACDYAAVRGIELYRVTNALLATQDRWINGEAKEPPMWIVLEKGCRMIKVLLARLWRFLFWSKENRELLNSYLSELDSKLESLDRIIDTK